MVKTSCPSHAIYLSENITDDVNVPGEPSGRKVLSIERTKEKVNTNKAREFVVPKNLEKYFKIQLKYVRPLLVAELNSNPAYAEPETVFLSIVTGSALQYNELRLLVPL